MMSCRPSTGKSMCRCRPAVYVGGGPSYRSMMLKERAKLLDREQLAPSSMRGRRKARRRSASSRIWRGNATLHTRYSRLGLFCWNNRAQRERSALTCSKHTHIYCTIDALYCRYPSDQMLHAHFQQSPTKLNACKRYNQTYQRPKQLFFRA